MKRYLLWGVFAYLLFLVATFPAELALGMALDRQTGVGVSDVEGTLWEGSAGTVAGSGLSLGPVVWDWRPSALLFGRLEYDTFFQMAGGGGEARLGRSLLGSSYLKDVTGSLDGGQINQWLALPGTQVGGSVLVDFDTVDFKAGTVARLKGTLVWDNARVTSPVEVALGTLKIEFSEDADQINGVISDDGGPLAVSGAVALVDGAHYSLNARIKPRASADPALTDALSMLGQPDRSGAYSVAYSGTL